MAKKGQQFTGGKFILFYTGTSCEFAGSNSVQTFLVLPFSPLHVAIGLNGAVFSKDCLGLPLGPALLVLYCGLLHSGKEIILI